MTPELWKEIGDVYHQAKQGDGRARQAFLDQACAGDAELRREVESLLQSDNEAETFLATPEINLAAQMIAGERRASLIGKRISHYEIVERTGAGGMGEVYRARDTRLGRDVAIKVLPLHFARDDQLRWRFEREARAISSLSHPHICAIYDVGHQDGINYLVLEYVEGETLIARLARGAMPVDQALRYATEIADALDHAHRRAIVHRDLKPGNIILNKTGAKLLDFGLAKFQQPGPSASASASSAPTESAHLTGKGTILGTLQYMAPEQLEGKDADARTDIFALGAVIYEMTTGRRAFEGQSQASLIAAILHVEPASMSELQPAAPAALERVVKLCLAKDPEERWQTAHDLRLQLKWIADGASQSQESVATATRRTKRERHLWAAALLVAALTVGVTSWLLARAPSPTARPVSRFAIEPPANLRLAKDERPVIALSPDGRWLAYVSDESGRNEVYLASFPGPGGKRQISTGGGTSPLWARNGKELFYRNGNKMMAVAISLQPAFKASTPQVLFEGEYEESGRPDTPRNYDVTPDGQRFVMIKHYEESSTPSQLIMALDWFDDLGRRAPRKTK